MEDLVLGLVIILMAGRLSKRSVNFTMYIFLLSFVCVFVLTFSALALLHSDLVDFMRTTINYIESLGIGEPNAWVVRTDVFKDGIEVCYYLTFIGAYLTILLASSYELKNMESIMDCGYMCLFGCLWMFTFLFSGVYFFETKLDGRFRILFDYVHNTLAGLLVWQLGLLLLADVAGRVIRAFFHLEYSLSNRAWKK